MRLDYLLIGIVLFSAIVVSGAIYINDLRDNYTIAEDINSTYMRNTYNTLNEMSAISEQQQNASFTHPISDSDSTGSLTVGAYSSLLYITKAFPLLQNIITDLCYTMEGLFGITTCGLWIGVAMTVIIIAVVFSIVVMILRAYVIQ